MANYLLDNHVGSDYLHYTHQSLSTSSH